MAFFPVLTRLVTAALLNTKDRAANKEADDEANARQAELLERLRSIDDRLGRLEGDRG